MPRPVAFAVLLAALILVAPACDTNQEPDGGTATVTLTNNGPQDVHLLTAGESMSPANRVAPGASRTTTVEYRGVFDFAVFRAERPEGVLAEVGCGTPPNSSTGLGAVWTGGSAMACTGGWRPLSGM